jgi:uncharacterized integral membrane protein (TIGR00697 family)
MGSKQRNLFIILTGIFLTNALLAEMIGVKIFSLEKFLNVEPANIPLFKDIVLDFNLTAGVIIWPVVFITTDIINEYFGKKGVRKISFLTAGFILYAFIVVYIITYLPPADFWLDVNSKDAEGNAFNINYAFQSIFRQGQRIIVASLIAFVIGQLLDVFVFQRLRRITGDRMIWLRATGSTLVSQFVDSFVVLYLAFHLFIDNPEQKWPMALVLSVGIINYIYKFVVAIALTPVIYAGHYLIDRFLGKELAEKMKQEATETSTGFF